MLITGSALDVLEVPAAIGRGICAQLRAADIVVPVAATPTGSWWYPVTPGSALPAGLREAKDVVLHARRRDRGAALAGARRLGALARAARGVRLRRGSRRPDLLRRSDSSGAAGRRRQHIRAPSGPPVWSPSECGPEETAAPASGSARAAAPVEARRGKPGRRRCDPTRGHFPRVRGRTANVAGVGGSPPTPASTNQRRRLREPNAAGRMGANTRPTTLPPAGSPTPGGVVRAAAREVRPTIRTPGIRRCRHYGFVTTSQTPRSDAGPPIKQRGTTPVVEFGLGFGRMDAATRAKDLRKMKRGATSLLLVAAVIFLCRAVVGGQRRAGLDRLHPGDGRGGHGRRAGRLVRRHRALPPPAGAADPAHGDHPDEEGRARRQPRRLRRRELPRRGRRARQARPHRGGHAGRGVDRPGGQRRPGHRRARDGRARRRHGAARRRRAGDHRAGPRPQAHGEAARPAAGHRAAGGARRRGAPPAGRPRLRPRLRLGHAATRRWCCGSSTSGRRAGPRGSSTTSSPTRCSRRCRTSRGR